jgi:hypothetical protein
MTKSFLSAAAGPLGVLAAVVMVTSTILVVPPADRPALVDSGPISGHSLLHFPR